MYTPSCDGGLMTLVHTGLRVPALGFSGIILGGCMLLYPAFVQAQPTPANPHQVLATCEYGGDPTKIRLVDDSGKARIELWCPLDESELSKVSPHYSSIIPMVPAP